MFPNAIIADIHAAPAPMNTYAWLMVPVVLVTSTRGREVYQDTRRLFERLEAIGRELQANGQSQITAIWHSDQHVSASGVLALELMLELTGLRNFNRASKAQRGGARAIGTKYQWYFLSEYLGWNWEK